MTNISVFAKTFSDGITSVSIPDSLRNVGAGAFAGASGLTEAVLPNSVTNVGPFAFTDCSNLVSVSIGSGVRTLCDGAFSHCPVLDGVTVPDTVVETGVGVFQDCRSLRSVSLGNGRKSVGTTMFKDCTALERIVVPACVTNVNGGAFLNCSNLREVRLPESVSVIGNEAFRGCSSLASFAAPEELELLGERAFADCVSLSEFVPSAGLQGYLEGTFAGCISLGEAVMPRDSVLVGREAFFGCARLTNVVWNAGTELVDEWAFGGCSALESVSVPDSVRAILPNAFWGCTNLARMDLPFCGVSGSLGAASASSCFGVVFGEHPFEDSVETVQSFSPEDGDEVVFYLPDALKSVTVRGGTLQTGAFSGCWTLEEIVLGEGVPAVPDLCFVSCEALRSVRFPEGAETIGAGALAFCTGLRSVHLPASLSGMGASAFLRCDALEEATYGPNEGGTALVAPEGCSLGIEGVDPDEGRIVIGVNTPDVRDRIEWRHPDGGDALLGTNRFASVRLDDARRLRVVVVPVALFALDAENIRLSDPDEAPWNPAEDASAVGGRCLRSGAIGANGTSSVETALVGPGTLSFRWKISASRGDACTFYLDGTETGTVETRNGTMTTWATVTLDVPAGEHAARWTYARGSGSPAGEDAAFLDAVDWRPELSLAVSSAWGAASPAAGTHAFVYGDEVEASVSAPAAANGTRRVCTGWTGTGSVPASGTEDSLTFAIKENSSIVWNWRTDHWIDVAVSGGSTDFVPRWIEEGTEVAAEIVPATHLHSISISGDTAGATLDGMTLRFAADRPRTIRVRIDEVKVPLSVESEWGNPSPTNGVHLLSWGTEVAASVANPEPEDGVQRVCTGWRGTGSVPASGRGSRTVFTLAEESSLVWEWKTNVLIRLETDGAVETDRSGGWTEKGTTVVANWIPTAEFYAVSLSGDADGVTLDETHRTLEIPADRPRTLVLSVRTFTIPGALDAQGLHWETGGDAPWFPQAAETSDGEDAAQSGGVLGDGVSYLETTLSGPGTFAWSWKIDAAGNAGVDVLLDGTWRNSFVPASDWSRETLEIGGAGEHVVRFEFWNAGTAATAGDRAFVDLVSWDGGVPGGRKTQTTPVPVPFSWLDGDGVVSDGDYEAAAWAQAANGRPVWECYVADLDPEDPDDDLVAGIEMEDGQANVTILKGEKATRSYEIQGAPAPGGPWGERNGNSRFFRVKASLPE